MLKQRGAQQHRPTRSSKDGRDIDRQDGPQGVEQVGSEPLQTGQAIIGPVFGQIKDVRGIRSFMRTGKAAADSEWKLICSTHCDEALPPRSCQAGHRAVQPAGGAGGPMKAR
jgi:hypothetical protein